MSTSESVAKEHAGAAPPASMSSPAAVAPSGAGSVKEINDIIKSCNTCMFTTLGEHGIHARPMSTAGMGWEENVGERGGDVEAIYFVTSKDCLKVAEIEKNPNVALVFSDDGKHQWASVTATASVDEDLERIRSNWKPAYNAFYPKGPDTEGVVLIKALAIHGSYWKGTIYTRLQIMFSALKAKATGQPIDSGLLTQIHKEVDFKKPGSPATEAAEAIARTVLDEAHGEPVVAFI